MIDLKILNVVVALFYTGYSAYTDYKTSEVPDKLSYIVILYGLLTAWMFGLQQYLFAFGIFLFTFVLYLFGQIGGGDVMLFTALTLLLPSKNYPITVPIFFLAGLMGPMSFYPLYYIRKLWKRGIVERRALIKLILLWIALLPLAILWLNICPLFLLLLIPLALSFITITFKDLIYKEFCLVEKAIDKLTDDDVIALEFMQESVKKRLGIWRKTLLWPEIRKVQKRARQFGIKVIPVYENLPVFVPFIFIALILILLFGDPFMAMFKACFF